ncbi:hypothetical protein [Methylobacterium durans]|uniref:Uncharacterized protein n=1 Tax=Methylobacterium durans TaxID=2202825 RepID=A0A2U8W486_9HYPH|nr:hypothetical protein [Methylobacterium durans]AWN40914.1 hypothetical protein DK389_10740 [Methylobacterium durans]
MSAIRIHLQDAALPPLHPPAATRSRIAPVFALAPVRRGLFCLVALALPVLGIGLADQVHRANRSGTPQAAAPLTPSRGAAALSLGPRSGGTTLVTLDLRQRP